jgi:hypothetical protein
LFEKIEIERKAEVEVARKFTDYTVKVAPMPEGVTLIERV